MEDNLYEQLHKANQLQKETIMALRVENRKLKKALNEVLGEMSGAIYEWSEFQAHIDTLNKMLEKYRKLNLETDED